MFEIIWASILLKNALEMHSRTLQVGERMVSFTVSLWVLGLEVKLWVLLCMVDIWLFLLFEYIRNYQGSLLLKIALTDIHEPYRWMEEWFLYLY